MGWGGIAKTIGAWYPPHRHGTVMGFVSINFQFGGVAAALFAGFLVAQGVGWTWITKFLVDIGMVNVDAQIRTAVIAALGVLGTVLLGWYTDKYAKDGDRARAMWIMLSGLGFCLLAVAFLANAGEQAHITIVILLGLSSFCLLGPYSMSSGCITLDISGSEGAGSCTGMIDGVGYFGASLATIGAGVISDSMGWSQVFVILAILAFIATGAAYLMSRDYRKELVHLKTNDQ